MYLLPFTNRLRLPIAFGAPVSWTGAVDDESPVAESV